MAASTLPRTVARAQLCHARRPDRVGRELGIEIADGLRRHAHIRGDEPLERASAPIARVGVARGRNDDAFGMHVDRVRRHAGIAAAEIEMVCHGAGEGDDAAVGEDRREDEDVLQVLAATVGIVVDVEIAWLEASLIGHWCTQARKISDIEPRCIGISSAWATTLPNASNSAADASCASRTMFE